MNQRKALELALQFCEFLWQDVAMNEYAEGYRNRVEDATRAALAEPQEPVQEPVAWANMKDGEPVLLSISQHPEDRANWMNPVPLYLHPASVRQPQEPVAWRYWSTKWHSWEYSDAPPVFPAVPAGTKVEPLYTAPVRQPLTEEEIKRCERYMKVFGATPFEQLVYFARAIERAHGIGVQDE